MFAITSFSRSGAYLGAGLLALLLSGAAAAEGIAAKITGTPEVVLSEDDFGCGGKGNLDAPDVPPTAFRRADGTVVFLATNRKNIAFSGPSLEQLSRQGCTPLYTADEAQDPGAFRDQQWLLALYSADGQNVVGIVHNEHHGEDYNPACVVKGNIEDRPCWYASSLRIVSQDGGKTFVRPEKDAVILSPPVRYKDFQKRRGTFLPKIVSSPKGGTVYALISRTDRNKGVRIGQCLMKSSDKMLASWQIFENGKFVEAPPTPYEDASSAEKFGYCDSVIDGNVLSVKYSTALKTYVAVVADAKGVYVQTSADMTSWSKRVRLKTDGIFQSTQPRGTPRKTWYFSLLDPSDSSRNFDRIGAKPYLYYVEYADRTAKRRNARKVMRVEMSLTPN